MSPRLTKFALCDNRVWLQVLQSLDRFRRTFNRSCGTQSILNIFDFSVPENA